MDTINNDNMTEQAAPPDAEEMATWTRRYAQSRSFPVLVSMPLLLALVVVLGFLWHTVGQAYRSGNSAAFWLSIVALVPANLFLIWFSIPSWGGKWLERVTWRYYDREGKVTLPHKKSLKWRKREGAVVGTLFGLSMLACVAFGLAGYIPEEHMMPVSAIYTVPFLTYLAWRIPNPWALIWAGLYAAHAMLMVAGVPIRFTGALEGLNMLLPVAGYGFVSALIGHIYNRFALRKTQEAARKGLGTGHTGGASNG